MGAEDTRKLENRSGETLSMKGVDMATVAIHTYMKWGLLLPIQL